LASSFLGLVLCVAVAGCSAAVRRDTLKTEETRTKKYIGMEQMVGKKLDALIAKYGLPDLIESPFERYQRFYVKDESSESEMPKPVITLTYSSAGKRVDISKDCVVLSVFETKDTILRKRGK
jgi:hypothetical protein